MYAMTALVSATRLLPYGCVATGHKLGFIEVVRRADTIANIQKNHKTARPKLTWDSQVLYQWLKEKNQTEARWESGHACTCICMHMQSLVLKYLQWVA